MNRIERMPVSIYVSDLDTAVKLRQRRLLTSSLRFEPTFKHHIDQDDPDQEPDLTTKKGRKVASFSFEHLLPLSLTTQEAFQALDLNLIVLQRIEATDQTANGSQKTFLVKPTAQSNGHDIRQWSEIVPQLSRKDVVFRDLWARGFLLVDGLKFGVDYLAYGKDALRYHADFMVLIVNEHEAYGSNLDLTAMCAVAGKARKQLLIASVNQAALPKVTYVSVVREAVLMPSAKRSRRSTGVTNDEDDLEDLLVG